MIGQHACDVVAAPRGEVVFYASADEFLLAKTWDRLARRWVDRPPGAPIIFEQPAETRTPAELFGSWYGGAETREFNALVEAGMLRGEAAAARWQTRARQGWTPGEIAAVLAEHVNECVLEELEARYDHLQNWGEIAPPRHPRPGARRLLHDCTWRGGTWTPTIEGECWPVPPSNEWIRLRCTPETRPGHPERRAHKAFTWTTEGWAKEGENPGWLFEAEPVLVPNEVDAWGEFFQAQGDDRQAFIVRGVLTRNPDRRGRVRRAKTDDKGAWIGEHPFGHRVMLLDVDDRVPVREVWPEWPGFDRVPTADEIADLVRRVLCWALPDAFHEAACAVHFSSSAGVPGGGRGPTGWGELRAHIAIVCTRPFCDAAFRAWLNEHVRKIEVVDKKGKVTTKPVIDTAPADPIQYLYLADPVFEGAPSPWPAHLPRVMVLDGIGEVETPAGMLDGQAWRKHEALVRAYAELAQAEDEEAIALGALEMEIVQTRSPRTSQRRVVAEAQIDRRVRAWCDAVIARAERAIADDPHHDRGLIPAALRAYSHVSPGLLEEQDVRRCVIDAWTRAPWRQGDTEKGRQAEATRALDFAASRSAFDRVTRAALLARFDIGHECEVRR